MLICGIRLPQATQRQAGVSNLASSPRPDPCAAEVRSTPVIEGHPAREAVLGPGLKLRRALPTAGRRLVGPWCFLDHFGPVTYESGKPVDVAPHPHIGLQTVTWLIEGEVLHKDSLGYEALIRPGELNLMTAGCGIAHSEETPPQNSGRIHGVQLWVALPDAQRHVAPAFSHYDSLPVIRLETGRATVIIGELAATRSPATAYSPIVGAELMVEDRAGLSLPLNPAFEHALVVLEGAPELEGKSLTPGTLYYLGMGREVLGLAGEGRARAMLIGGAPFGEQVLMWWNFVARAPEEIAQAREDWLQRRHFGEVKGYAGARLEAPALQARPLNPS